MLPPSSTLSFSFLIFYSHLFILFFRLLLSLWKLLLLLFPIIITLLWSLVQAYCHIALCNVQLLIVIVIFTLLYYPFPFRLPFWLCLLSMIQVKSGLHYYISIFTTLAYYTLYYEVAMKRNNWVYNNDSTKRIQKLDNLPVSFHTSHQLFLLLFVIYIITWDVIGGDYH